MRVKIINVENRYNRHLIGSIIIVKEYSLDYYLRLDGTGGTIKKEYVISVSKIYLGGE